MNFLGDPLVSEVGLEHGVTRLRTVTRLNLQYDCLRYGVVYSHLPCSVKDKEYNRLRKLLSIGKKEVLAGKRTLNSAIEAETFYSLTDHERDVSIRRVWLEETRQVLLRLQYETLVYGLVSHYRALGTIKDVVGTTVDLVKSPVYSASKRAISRAKEDVQNGKLTLACDLDFQRFGAISDFERSELLSLIESRQTENTEIEEVKRVLGMLRYECAKYGVKFPLLPYSAFRTLSDLRSSQQYNTLKRAIRRQKKEEADEGFVSLQNVSVDRFLGLDELQQNKLSVMLEFEGTMLRVRHKHCTRCHKVSLYGWPDDKKSVCVHCAKQLLTPVEREEIMQNVYPTWKDESGAIHHELPEDLVGLTIAEQLLIQKASPLIPIMHIKNGTFGCKGHVCTFIQRVNETCRVLPRLPENCQVVKVIRTHITTGGTEVTKAYSIRRTKVLAALRWLKRYNIEYQDIEIDESNLDWMNGEEEAELNSVHVIDQIAEDDEEKDRGPAENQVFVPEEQADQFIEASGSVNETDAPFIPQSDADLLESMKLAADDPHTARIEWPTILPEPISEYSDKKIFVMAFPWLYPGGKFVSG